MRVPTYRAAATLATVFAATTLSAQDTPYDLRDMVGARAGQAENALMERGYVNVNTRAGDDRKWTNWWNASRQACVTIMTRNGRYEAITTTPAPDCRQSDVAGARPPPGGPAGPIMAVPTMAAPATTARAMASPAGAAAGPGGRT